LTKATGCYKISDYYALSTGGSGFAASYLKDSPAPEFKQYPDSQWSIEDF